MTVVDRRMFDELAHCLRVNKVGNALILQIADVCARANRNFKRDWFLSAAGYSTITSKVKVLKLRNKTRVIPMNPMNTGDREFDDAAARVLSHAIEEGVVAPPDVTPAVWPKQDVVQDALAHDLRVGIPGWDEIEPGPEQSYAPPRASDE